GRVPARAGRVRPRAGVGGNRHVAATSPAAARPRGAARVRTGPGVRVAVLVFMAVLAASPVCAQEGVFLREEQAPAAVFPDADHFARSEVESTPELRERLSAPLDRLQPSLRAER